MQDTPDLSIMPGAALPACAQAERHIFQVWVSDTGAGLKTQELRQGNALRDLRMESEGVTQLGLEGISLQRAPNPLPYSHGHWSSGSLLTSGPDDSPPNPTRNVQPCGLWLYILLSHPGCANTKDAPFS